MHSGEDGGRQRHREHVVRATCARITKRHLRGPNVVYTLWSEVRRCS